MALEHQPLTLNIEAIHTSPPGALADDFAVCREIMRSASKNYSFAARFLPADKLPYVEALYALMRVGDDIVDVQYKGEKALAAIQEFEHQYWHTFETGHSSHPVLRAYLHTARQFDISPELLRPYFRAMIDDLSITRFPTFDDLLHYMEGSAMTVGRVMSHILGAKTRRVRDVYPEADALSIAMQLSNFWRDIGQDWGIGRVYIPQEDLERFGYSEDDIAHQRINHKLIDLIEFEIKRTEQYYEKARRGVSQLASGQWAVMSALNIYHAILPGIRSNGYNVFTRRAGSSKLRKIGLVMAAWYSTR